MRVNESWGNRIQWETKLVQPAVRFFFFLLVSWCLLPENIILLITVFCHSSFYYTMWQQAAYWNENKWFKHLSKKQHNLWISIIVWIWSATDARIILNADSGLTVFKIWSVELRVERGTLLHCFLCAYYLLQWGESVPGDNCRPVISFL